MSTTKFKYKSLVVTQKYRTTWEARRWGRKLVGRVLLDDAGYLVKGPYYTTTLGRCNDLYAALDLLNDVRAQNNLPVAS
jgi:hypothetical protein